MIFYFIYNININKCKNYIIIYYFKEIFFPFNILYNSFLNYFINF